MQCLSFLSCGNTCNKTHHCLPVQQRAHSKTTLFPVADKLNTSCHDWDVPLFCMSVWHKIYTTPTSPTENFGCFHLPILWTTQSCWQRGQRLFCFTHNDMQQLWKEWLHSPQTTEREERTCSSHAQLSRDQHSQQGPSYFSQMFKTTANL